MIEVVVGVEQVQELVPIETELDAINKCREYDHFGKDCPTTKIEKEEEQIQQMYYMDEEKPTLKLLATDIYDSLNKINLIDEMAMDHLDL